MNYYKCILESSSKVVVACILIQAAVFLLFIVLVFQKILAYDYSIKAQFNDIFKSFSQVVLMGAIMSFGHKSCIRLNLHELVLFLVTSTLFTGNYLVDQSICIIERKEPSGEKRASCDISFWVNLFMMAVVLATQLLYFVCSCFLYQHLRWELYKLLGNNQTYKQKSKKTSSFGF